MICDFGEDVLHTNVAGGCFRSPFFQILYVGVRCVGAGWLRGFRSRELILTPGRPVDAFDFLICFGALINFFGVDDVVEVGAEVREDVGTGGVVGAVLNFIGVVGDVE